MQNKMTERRNTLGRGAIASRLNSPIMQKIEDKLFFTLQNSLITKTIKAFSIAEAMITLTIVSVIAASVAPMISKQVKINEMGDVQANILNQKIIDLSKTKWFHTPDKKSITRPDGNVGIGVSEGTNPEAKLEVNNTNSSLVGMLLKVPENHNSDIFSVKTADMPRLWMSKNGALGIGVTKDGLNNNLATINVSDDGIMDFMPPYNATYESDNKGSPAIRVFYPKDSDAKYDNYQDKTGKWVYATNDGRTNTFLLTSYGSMYINSIAPSGVAFSVRNGAKQRFAVNNTGTTYINLKRGAKWGLIVKDDDDNNLFVVNEDGSTYVKGEISNPDLDTKFAKINIEMDDAKKLIVKSQETINELRAENIELKEKLANFESQLAEVVALNSLQKITQKK